MISSLLAMFFFCFLVPYGFGTGQQTDYRRTRREGKVRIMLSFLLALFFFGLLVPYGFGTGQPGVAVVGIVLAVICLVLGKAARDDAKAYNNFVDYWAKGGPEEAEKRQQEDLRRKGNCQERNGKQKM